MNWNDSLYWYWRERGGEFFASGPQKDSGVLFLDSLEGGPAFIQCESVPALDGRLRREIAVTLRASLEHPYYLTVQKARLFRGDGGGPHSPEDGDGVPELTARRSVRSSDPSQTPYLLQNRRLQKLLRADPGAWLQISPMQAGSLEHLVSARKDAKDLEDEVDARGRAAGRDVPNQRKLYAQSSFREQMDDLVDLVQTARDEVNLWPKGDQTTKKNKGEGA